jgi:hypothetical protein
MSPGGAQGSTFLSRLTADGSRRAAAAAAAARAAAAGPAAMAAAGDPSAAARRAAADAQILARVCGTRWGLALSAGGNLEAALRAYLSWEPAGQADDSPPPCSGAEDAERLLNEALGSYWKELGLSKARRDSLLGVRGRAKAGATAAAARAMEFMERYQRDLDTRDSRLEELQVQCASARCTL